MFVRPQYNQLKEENNNTCYLVQKEMGRKRYEADVERKNNE
jgi:hypothetical protein